MRECGTCKRCFTDETTLCPQDGAQTRPSLSGEPTLDARYQLHRRLGQGSMGIVFEARHIFLKTSHAIKILLPYLVGNDPMLVTRFRQQALVAARIRHQNIIDVTDFGVMSGTMPFLVMEFVNGKSLQDILAEEKIMPLLRAFEIIHAMAAGLGAAHWQNIGHYDLKPSNIMARNGMPIAEGLKILDFGLVKIKSSELLGSFARAQTGGLMDSVFYMAPEQWTNQEPDVRADIYSLGIILYQMLSGEVPFKGSTALSIMKQHLGVPPPSFKSLGVAVPSRLEAVVRHALEKEVFARTPSVEAFLDELMAGTTGTTLGAGRPTLAPELDEPLTAAPSNIGALPQQGSSETALDSLAGQMDVYDEESLGSSSHEREQQAHSRVTREALAREAEARRKAEEEIEQKRREIEEGQHQERERQFRELMDRTIRQANENKERLTQVEASMPPQNRIRASEAPPSPKASRTEPRTAETPIYLDENVQFTVYKPKKVRPQKWYTLLAYAHLSERRPDEDEADPIERMEAEVKRILGEQKMESYSRATEDSSQAIPRRGEITFLPFIAGVEFNPPSQSFLWQESVHGQEFRMLASAALDGKTARGQVSVFLGSILLAEINLSLRVDSAQVLGAEQVPLEKENSARPYRKVFPSYSHKDSEIVAQIEQYAQISGDKYLRDVYELRSGQNWKRWMLEAIEAADIFQLFWSTNSMRSENVKLEWQHALRLGRQNFIRPTYWENPLPQSPADNLPPPELLDLHFQQVRSPLSVSVAPARQDHVAGSVGNQSGSLSQGPPARQSLGTKDAETTFEAPGSFRVRRPMIVMGKLCPTCGRSYTDQSLNFCLKDGAPLLSDRSSAPGPGLPLATGAMPEDWERQLSASPQTIPAPLVMSTRGPQSPSNFIWFIVIALGVIGLIIGLLIVLFVIAK